MKFNISYNYDFETKKYIAEIPEFNISDYGDTIDEAEKNLKEALSLYLEEIVLDNIENNKNLIYA